MKKRLLLNPGQFTHQGDVFIRKMSNSIDKAPKEGTKVKASARGLIVHHGEAAGHDHDIVDPEVVELTNFKVTSPVKKMWLTVKKNTTLRHKSSVIKENDDLHDPIELTPGSYEIHTQQEADREGFLRPVSD